MQIMFRDTYIYFTTLDLFAQICEHTHIATCDLWPTCSRLCWHWHPLQYRYGGPMHLHYLHTLTLRSLDLLWYQQLPLFLLPGALLCLAFLSWWRAPLSLPEWAPHSLGCRTVVPPQPCRHWRGLGQPALSAAQPVIVVQYTVLTDSECEASISWNVPPFHSNTGYQCSGNTPGLVPSFRGPYSTLL